MKKNDNDNKEYGEYSYFAHWNPLRRKFDLALGLGSMALALVIYLATMCTGVFPDTSAALMVTHTGIEPLVMPEHPVWSVLVNAIGKIGLAHMPWYLNFFSLLCCVLGTGLMYFVTSRLTLSFADHDDHTARNAVAASSIAGVVAALALAFSVPYWISATRLHFESFDLLFLLALAALLVYYVRTDNVWILLLMSLGLGLAVTESIFIALFIPLFLVACFKHWLDHNDVNGWRIFLVVVFGLVGLCNYLLAARNFCATQDITLRGYSGFGAVLIDIVRNQAKQLMTALPQVGWLLIVALVIIPWVAMLAIAPRALNGNRSASFTLFHVALSATTVAVLGNSPISPWATYRAIGGLPVFLTALAASTAGYLAAYYFVTLANRGMIPHDDFRRLSTRLNIWCGYAFGCILVAVIAATSFINGFEASGHRGDFADECAREILDHSKDRPWLVSSGILDNHVMIEAARRGQELHILALQNNDNIVYLRKLRKDFEESDFLPADKKVRLLNSIDLGVVTFIQDWIDADPSIVDKMSVMNMPDLLVTAKFNVLPNYLSFVGAKDVAAYRDYDFIAEYSDFWKKMKKTLGRSRSSRDAVANYRAIVRRQVGYVANNIGVLLEDLGRDEDAYKVFMEVRDIDPENISALLNLVELFKRHENDGFHADEKARIETALKEFIANLKGRRYPVWSLARAFGYVRSPEIFARLGWNWAMSGQPGMAISGMEQAGKMLTGTARTRNRQAVAQMLFDQNETSESERIYKEILESDPTNNSSMIALARIKAREGSFESAREWLEKARAAGADDTTVSIESAAIDLAAGRPDDARIKLQQITELSPKNLRAWGLLAVAAIGTGDLNEVEENVIPKMEAITGTPDNYIIQIVRGQVALQKGKDHLGEARNAFERAASLRPGLIMLNEWILRLDFMMNDKPSAEMHARAILRQNRDNSFANYIMGSLMLERGRSAESEDYLRRSIGTARSPEALNDLAELLRKVGKHTEAESVIRQAVDAAPTFYVLWDTLGGVLADTGRLEQAEEAYLKALELYNGDYRVHLNLAKLYVTKKNAVKAREMLVQVQPHRDELPLAEREELANLSKQLTVGGGK